MINLSDLEAKARAVEHYKFQIMHDQNGHEALCIRLSKSTLEYTAAVNPNTVRALIDRLKSAEDEVKRLEDENQEEAAIWPAWAEQILKAVRKYSGYDGHADADGVDLPGEVFEQLAQMQNEIDVAKARIRALEDKTKPYSSRPDDKHYYITPPYVIAPPKYEWPECFNTGVVPPDMHRDAMLHDAIFGWELALSRYPIPKEFGNVIGEIAFRLGLSWTLESFKRGTAVHRA